MWITSGAPDSVTADAEHFTRATVAARAPNRVQPCGRPVIVRSAWRSRPPWRMWISSCRIGAGNAFARVAIDTEQLAVADDAHARISRRLHVVNRKEIRSVHRLSHRRIEGEPRRNCRHSDPVACRALALRVAGGAQVGLGGCLQAVLAEEVTIVYHVAFRWDPL